MQVNFTSDQVAESFRKTFKSDPIVIRSPGRINLIGEHVDYNQGLVLPAAIDKHIFIAIGFAVEGESSTVRALNYDGSISVDADKPSKIGEPYWANYLLGILNQFKAKGHKLQRFNCVIGGDIPTGAGLSSSAALECGFAFAVNELHQFKVSKADLIAMAMWSEHNYVGVKCGIMDQFSNVMGKKDHAILLDCRTLDFEYYPVSFSGYSFVLIDSNVKHSLGNSEYNIRHQECETGVNKLAETFDGVRSLRDVTSTMLHRGRGSLGGKIYNRCLFVVEEIARVLDSVKALKNQDAKAFGSLMFGSHDGLAKLYEVSCKELDFLVDFARRSTGVVGARMMGGGFGGCTINLVYDDFMDEFVQDAMEAYRSTFTIDPVYYKVHLVDGTSIV